MLTAILALLLGTAAAAEPRGADLPEPEPRGERWDVYGEARVRFDAMNPAVLDDKGTLSERSAWLSTRLVAGASFNLASGLDLALEVEAFNGQLAGEWTGVGLAANERPFRVSRRSVEDLSWVMPRKASITLSRPTGRFSVGIQDGDNGLGILANGGRRDPAFGDVEQGNVVARVGGAFTPWRPKESAGLARGLAVLLAGDFVLRDEGAHAFHGDIAFAGIGGLRLQAPRGGVGVVGSVRYQIDRTDPNHPATERPYVVVWPLDVSGSWRFGREDGPLHFTLAAEGALLLGRTNRSYGEETTQGSDIVTYGGLLRGRLDIDPARLTVLLDVGYASGDGDPRDGTARTFTMHSDHNAGLILFDQLLPTLTARSADRVSDPELIAQPPAGLRHTVAQGGVRNAFILNPVLLARPVNTLELRVGWLLAVAAAPVQDLHQTARNGGYTVGWGGQSPAGRLYGNEIDAGVRLTIPIPGRLGLEFGAEGGLFVPGDVFDGLNLPLLGTVRGRADLRW